MGSQSIHPGGTPELRQRCAQAQATTPAPTKSETQGSEGDNCEVWSKVSPQGNQEGHKQVSTDISVLMIQAASRISFTRIRNKMEGGKVQYDNKKSKGKMKNEQKTKRRPVIFLHLFVNTVFTTNLIMETFLVQFFFQTYLHVSVHRV